MSEDFFSDSNGKGFEFQSQQWSVPRDEEWYFTVIVQECSWVLFLAALVLAMNEPAWVPD